MSPKTINLVVVPILAVLIAAVFANSMTSPVSNNEQASCTAGVLLAGGKMIYRDFSYVGKMPYYPLLCAAVFRALNTTHYLLVCRILSCLSVTGILLCIIGIYRRIFCDFPLTGLLLGLAGAILFVFNPLIDFPIRGDKS